MIETLAYILIVCVVISQIGVQGSDEDSRNSILVIASGIHAIYKILDGVQLSIDDITTLSLWLSLWVIASLLWSSSNRSRMEACTWISYMYLFNVTRTIPVELSIWVVMVLGAPLAAVQVYRKITSAKGDNGDYVGNTNHNASFLGVVMIATLYGAVHVSPMLFIVAFIVAVSIGLSKCTGGIVATLLAMSVIVEWSAWVAMVALVASVVVVVRHLCTKSHTSNGRLVFWVAAVKMIVESPIFGHGLNFFRQNFPEKYAVMAQSGRCKKTGYVYTHRVHNDHLELMVELGIVGYTIFLIILLSSIVDQWSLSLVVLFTISGSFFFPFREVHTAAPFWVMLGSLTGGVVETIVVPSNAMIIIVSLVMVMMWVALKRFLSLCFQLVAKRTASTVDKVKLMDTCHKLDPMDSTVLSEESVYKFGIHPVDSVFLSFKALSTFDGGIQKCQLWDQFASIVEKVDSRHIARWARNKAKELNPN